MITHRAIFLVLGLGLLPVTGVAHAALPRCSEQSPKWDLNDVSILLPLLNNPTVGLKSQLLPGQLYSKLPTLVFKIPSDQTYQELSLVAVRWDAPRSQIRLVWQPKVVTQAGVTTRDAAIHTFHTLAVDAAQVLEDELQSLKCEAEHSGVSTRGLALQIHPALVDSSTRKRATSRITRILKRFATTQSLTRVTLMQLDATDVVWIFTGFDVIHEKEGGIRLLAFDVPRTNSFSQSFDTQDASGRVFNGRGASPRPRGLSDTLDDVTASDRSRRPLTEDQLWNVLQTLDRIENPSVHSAETMDCVTCHVAQPVGAGLRLRHPGFLKALEASEVARPWVYQALHGEALNLESKSVRPEHTLRLRMFGYFESDAMISPRVVYETADVVLFLRQRK